MKVTYIDHSSFLIELKQCSLLFDYFQGEIPPVDVEKPLIVFASHRHGDHFSPLIFDLFKIYPKVRYVISDDIWQNRVPAELEGKALFMGADEEEEVGNLLIKTYQSTDEGVAFLIKSEEACIYHAGDLNHWNWIGEPEEWNRKMGENYHKELDKMAGERIDVAFLPIDPRLKENFYLGADDFMRAVGADVVFPMHMWDDYSVAAKFKELPLTETYRDKVMEIHGKGESFLIDL